MTVVTCKWVSTSASSVSSANLRNTLFYFTVPVVKVQTLSTELSIHRPLKELIGLYSSSLIGKKNKTKTPRYSLNSFFRKLCSHVKEISARLCFPDLLGNLTAAPEGLLRSHKLKCIKAISFCLSACPSAWQREKCEVWYDLILISLLSYIVLKWTVILFSYIQYERWT